MSRFYHNDPPQREDYDTEEEYNEACYYWDSAESDYIDSYEEEHW